MCLVDTIVAESTDALKMGSPDAYAEATMRSCYLADTHAATLDKVTAKLMEDAS
jgi:hypothetical protein